MATKAFYNDPLELRKRMDEWERSLVEKLGPVDDRIEEFYYTIALPDGYGVRSKIWKPKASATNPRPVILLFHGGGFILGSAEMCTRPGREFAMEFDAVVISATYRLAPEHQFPQQALDGLEVLRWVVDNAEEEFGASPGAGLIVGGYSAGGNVAAVVASEARFMSLRYPITGSFICIALLFTERTVPQKYKPLFTSREENDIPPAGKQSVSDCISNAGADSSSPLFCAVHHAKGLRGLPRTAMQVGGKDVMRDDCVVYARLLEDAGIEVRLDNHAEIGHGAWTIFTDMNAPTSDMLKEKTLDAIRWLLRR